MATPDTRRIVFSTSVVPKVEYQRAVTTVEREEGSNAGRTGAAYQDWKLDDTVGKKFGGKGTVTIHSDQEGFVSFQNPVDDETAGLGIEWQHCEANFDEVAEITSTDYTLRQDTVTCNFLYLKNIGSTTCYVALENDEWDLVVKPQASISIRLNSVSSDDIQAKTVGSDTTTIEYVLAKEPA